MPEIAFITGGDCEETEIKNFCKVEFSIDLPENFIHYNNCEDKAEKLKLIAKTQNKNPKDIILIDNSRDHILDAKSSGFSTVYVDTNGQCFGAPDDSNGENYIRSLDNINLYHSDCDFQITDESLAALTSIKQSNNSDVTDDLQKILQYIGKRSGNNHIHSGYLSYIGSFFGKHESPYSRENKLDTARAMMKILNGTLNEFTDKQVVALENGELNECYVSLAKEAQQKIDAAIAHSPSRKLEAEVDEFYAWVLNPN